MPCTCSRSRSRVQNRQRRLRGLLLASLTDQTQAEASVMLYETGEPDWYKLVPEMTTCDAGTPTRKIARRASCPIAPMTDGRRRGLKRRTPSRHDETRLYLPAVTSLIVRRETSRLLRMQVPGDG